MGTAAREVSVETTGETVREAKWAALRELERRAPGIDKASVRFEVLSEGERGLLGVGYAPARVIASAHVGDPPVGATRPVGSDAAEEVRDAVERIAETLGVSTDIAVAEDEETITVTCNGGELGILIGRHGQTIDAIQYLARAIAARVLGPERRKEVVVDAEGYRERRRATLEAIALRAAERALAGGRAIELEPMMAAERKVIHLRLEEHPGVETTSEGAEPNRYVVVVPSAD